MTFSRDITIIDLLRQREAELVVVWKCEQEIRRLLDDVDYPFPLPTGLPSLRKSKLSARKTASAKPAASGASSPAPSFAAAGLPVPECRKLDPARENAYRLVFLRNGVRDSSFQTDTELINTLAGLNCQEFQLLSLETVLFTDLDDWHVVDTLWAESPAGQ
ncbi:MAG: hypothetical protein PHC30_01585 [Lentisphaeria bacterium]|jgi:hypothetical protein|nr:hypothetical protein [Lentisphaeria bacterium]